MVLGVAALALSVRLAALPFATTDGSNPAARVWIAWKWLDDPNVITHGVWGPLHFYLIGAVLALTHDPVVAPIILHVLFGVGSAILFYIFVRNRVHGAEQRPARRSRLCRLSDLAARQRLGSRRNAVRLLRLGQHGSAVVGAHASSCHSTGGCGRSDAHHGFHASLRRMATDTSARPAPLATNYPDVRVLGSGFRASRVLDDRECARVRRCALWHLLRAAVGAPIDGKDRP